MGMKELLTRRAKREAHGYRDEFERAATDNVIDLCEIRRLRALYAERVLPLVDTAADAGAYAAALERGAIDPPYIREMAVRLQARMESLPDAS